MLSPITTTPRRDEHSSSHFLGKPSPVQPSLPTHPPALLTATIPTIGDALEALSTLCTDLAQTLKRIADLMAELAARDHIGVDNIHEVCWPDFLADCVFFFLCAETTGRQRHPRVPAARAGYWTETRVDM